MSEEERVGYRRRVSGTSPTSHGRGEPPPLPRPLVSQVTGCLSIPSVSNRMGLLKRHQCLETPSERGHEPLRGTHFSGSRGPLCLGICLLMPLLPI